MKTVVFFFYYDQDSVDIEIDGRVVKTVPHNVYVRIGEVVYQLLHGAEVVSGYSEFLSYSDTENGGHTEYYLNGLDEKIEIVRPVLGEVSKDNIVEYVELRTAFKSLEGLSEYYYGKTSTPGGTIHFRRDLNRTKDKIKSRMESMRKVRYVVDE